MKPVLVARLYWAMPLAFVLTYSIPVSLMPSPENTGDEKIDETTVNPYGPAYTNDQILAKLRELICDDPLVDEIADALNPETGWLKTVEIDHYPRLDDGTQPDGNHDKDTIGLRTKTDSATGTLGYPDGKTRLPLEDTAATLLHEYKHAKSARDNQQPTDPTTKGPCGAANHAKMSYDIVHEILDCLCDEMANMEESEKAAICEAVESALATGDYNAKQTEGCDPESSEMQEMNAAAAAASQEFSECCGLE